MSSIPTTKSTTASASIHTNENISASASMISNINEEDETLTFTLSGVNVSVANAIRRVILAEIPVVVFNTTKNSETVTITKNTSRLNNEIIKQRLSCIPVYLSPDKSIDDYIVEIDVENTTDTIIYVTTRDFRIKRISTNEYLTEKENNDIFPPNNITNCWIDFVRLRPKISEEIPGEKLQMTATFSVAIAKENYMYNAVSTCSYGYTIDEIEFKKQLELKLKEWVDAGKSEKEIEYDAENWKLLEGKRVIKKDSFNFIIETVGMYSNIDIVLKACFIMMKKIYNFKKLLYDDKIHIVTAISTIKNCFDVISQEGYTLGKVIEFYMYKLFYNSEKLLSYCTFDKFHPHDLDGTLRLGYKDAITSREIREHLIICLDESVEEYHKIIKELAPSGSGFLEEVDYYKRNLESLNSNTESPQLDLVPAMNNLRNKIISNDTDDINANENWVITDLNPIPTEEDDEDFDDISIPILKENNRLPMPKNYKLSKDTPPDMQRKVIENKDGKKYIIEYPKTYINKGDAFQIDKFVPHTIYNMKGQIVQKYDNNYNLSTNPKTPSFSPPSTSSITSNNSQFITPDEQINTSDFKTLPNNSSSVSTANTSSMPGLVSISK
jgi:DNA-directed RNA polymerase alpha subunit